MSKLALFSDIPNDRDLNLGTEIKRCLQRDIRECRWSREEIAERLSATLDRVITVAQLNAWTADTKPHRFPLELLAPWVVVTGSRRLLDIVISAAGNFIVADAREQQLADYARTLLEREKLTVREAKQRADLLEQRGGIK